MNVKILIRMAVYVNKIEISFLNGFKDNCFRFDRNEKKKLQHLALYCIVFHLVSKSK